MSQFESRAIDRERRTALLVATVSSFLSPFMVSSTNVALPTIAVDDAIAKIVEAPGRWPPFAGARRHILRRFPYNVIYRVDEEQIHILAIAHHRREPVYWGRRR